MARYLSPEWVQAFNTALVELDLTEAIAAAAPGSLTVSDGDFAVAQIVTNAPEGEGEVRTVLSVADGHASLVLDPSEAVPSNVTIVLAYDDALAMAQGTLDPADALAAGRVRVRGELAVLVAGQSVLNAAGVLLGPALSALTD